MRFLPSSKIKKKVCSVITDLLIESPEYYKNYKLGIYKKLMFGKSKSMILVDKRFIVMLKSLDLKNLSLKRRINKK